MNSLATGQSWLTGVSHYAEQDLPGKHLPWLVAMRQQALSDLQTREWPQRKLEAWRYTNIDSLLQQSFSYPDASLTTIHETDIEQWILDANNSYRLVFANGHYIPGMSHTYGLASYIKAGSLRAALSTDAEDIEPYLTAESPYYAAPGSQDIFAALNTALIDDGLFIHIPSNVQLDKPIEVLYLNLTQGKSPLIVPRNVVILDPGASATLIERFATVGNAAYFNNNVTHIIMNDDAQLTHYRVQDESANAHHLSRVSLVQGRGSDYRSSHLALGAKWSRSDIDVMFSGPGAYCDLSGLYMVKDAHLTDFHVNVMHNFAHCTSRVDFRGILAGKGRAVFDGRIAVQKAAQKTDAHLSNKNLLLSSDAEVDTKPQLEIDANDVKCSHGTTVGQIDPSQLFYLRTRGIDEAQAKRMLCVGFANEILQKLSLDAMKTFIEKRVTKQLSGLAEQHAETGKVK